MNVDTGEIKRRLTPEELASGRWVRLTEEEAVAAAQLSAQERARGFRDLFKRRLSRKRARRLRELGLEGAERGAPPPEEPG